MRKVITTIGLITVFMLVLSSVALAHPSENRAERAFFGGPHCHTNLMSGNFAFPSHKAHEMTGDRVFAAATCP